MEYVRLGNTGLEVSKLCLGGMSFGDANKWLHSWVLNQEQTSQIIQKSLALGINFFDTANVYSLGTSELYMGEVLRKYANRDEIVIATKVHGQMFDGPNGGGLSRKHIMSQVNQSLERLGMDYIDILYIHRWDYNTPIEETMCALNDLVRSGKVLYLGASAMYAWQFQKAQYVAEKNGWTKFSVMQHHYNLLYREDEREMIPLCQDMGIALVPYSPLASGRLARDWAVQTIRSQTDIVAKEKYDKTEEQDKMIAYRVSELAEQKGASRAQIALAWLWKKGVVAPVVGVTKETYLDDYIKAFDITLSYDEVAYLEELYIPHHIVGAI